MNNFTPFIIIGLSSGAVYGLAGIGLVLTYDTSGILNIGYGALAALGAYCFYFLHNQHRMPWPAAAAICLVALAPILGVVMERMARSLERAEETIKVAATVGIILIVESLGLLWHPTNPPLFPLFLPQSTVKIIGVNVTWERIILFAVSVVVAGALYWFFRSVRLGIVMRGVVDSPDLVSMSGDDPAAVRRWAWIIGCEFAVLAGPLLAHGQQLDGNTLTTVVFASFGAAAIGRFRNLPLTFVGGLLVGVAGALLDKYAVTISWIGGFTAGLPFVVLFLALILIPRRHFVRRGSVARMERPTSYRAPLPIRLGSASIVIGLLAIVPIVQSTRLAVWSAALIEVILLLSQGLLVRRSGQISLCTLAFAAVGAASFAHLESDGLPWLLSLVLSALIVVPVGAIVAIPAVRVSGVFLALATLGFGILMAQAIYSRNFMFGSSTLGLPEPRPRLSILGWHLWTDRGFYYLLLIIVVAVVLAVMALEQGRLGRLLSALADSPVTLETHGTGTSVLKVIVFCVAAMIASLAGALMGMLLHFGLTSSFQPFDSLTLVTLVVIITIGSPWYALIGAIGYSVIPAYITGETTTSVLNLLFGLGAVTAVYGVRASGVPSGLRRLLDGLGGARSGGQETSIAVTSEAAVTWSLPVRAAADRRTGLEVRDLEVRFGGLLAVNSVSLKVPMGRITGLIGPNGAGKTTTFNACSGLIRPNSGHVVLHGQDVTKKRVAERARLGLGRTFQRTELCDSLTVRENIAMGFEAAVAGSNPLTQAMGLGLSLRQIHAAADEAMNLTGTAWLADRPARLLTIGQRRLVELARSLVGPFDVLLLDEPSSGLDNQETEHLGRVLRAVVRERNYGVLLVEHDMSLVREICDRLYVLNFGTLIFHGNPEEMEASPEVRQAYLGDSTASGTEPDPRVGTAQ